MGAAGEVDACRLPLTVDGVTLAARGRRDRGPRAGGWPVGGMPWQETQVDDCRGPERRGVRAGHAVEVEVAVAVDGRAAQAEGLVGRRGALRPREHSELDRVRRRVGGVLQVLRHHVALVARDGAAERAVDGGIQVDLVGADDRGGLAVRGGWRRGGEQPVGAREVADAADGPVAVDAGLGVARRAARGSGAGGAGGGEQDADEGRGGEDGNPGRSHGQPPGKNT